MTQEVFKIVREMDLKNIETQLALQCAPLLTGLKISNLLIIPSENESLVRILIRKTGISCYRLARSKDKITFLLFRRMQLESFLKKENAKKILKEQGYDNLTLGGILAYFQMRYQAYKDGTLEFPHEMGILLGYPIEDVSGFINHKGRNYLYSGYWKVYENMQEKVALFQQYQKAKETLIRLLASGLKMEEILAQYSKKGLQKAAV